MKSSLQYRRTDKAIINAFMKLASEIPFEKITVQDILEEALVSRYTFYAHFHDKFEIAERLQEELYQDFLSFMQEKIPEIHAKKMPAREHHQHFDFEIAQFSVKNPEKLRAIKNIHTETIDFYRLLKSYFMDHYKETLPNHPEAELEAKIYANMVAAVMEYCADYSTDLNSNISVSVMQAQIHACLYGIGIHDAKSVQKAQEYLFSLAHKEK